MDTYIKNNGMGRVVIYGFHPMKDYVLIGSGEENDCRFVPYIWFISNFTKE